MSRNYFEDQQAEQAKLQMKTDEELARIELEQREINRSAAELEIDTSVDTVNRLAGSADQLRVSFEERYGRLRHTESMNDDLDTANVLRHASQLGILTLAISIALIIDFMFFGNFVSWFLEILGKEGAFVLAGQIIIPFVVVGLEVLVSFPLYSHRKAGNRLASLAYGVLGVGLILVFSSVTAATFLVGQGAETWWDLSFIQTLLSVPVLFISIAVHSMIVFSGKLGHDAKGYLVLLIARRRVRNRENKFEAAAENTVSAYRHCLLLLRQFRRLFDADFELAPEDFSDEARKIINQKTGRECIAKPDRDPVGRNGAASRGWPLVNPDEARKQ